MLEYLLYNKLFNPQTPAYLKEQFHYLSSGNFKSLRSSENLLLQTPLHTTSFYGKSFTVQAVRLWNALPSFIRLDLNIVSIRSIRITENRCMVTPRDRNN
ncbi:hypothetical protein K1T71_013601 [Dendrolimus kikuchii]|uniref:Uncharacterized protein n=1 Tax=Dendrolimus kikuchii TaxID=765133 RepID=A0ACC1CH90_9NEOP|nr:hypothetical protein K1T71_013601 [Dendrolimus kikuchii]